MPHGEEHPGDRRPRARPARPLLVELAFEQRGHGERERDREADVAQVEHRRMHGEREVLQQRVQVVAVRRRRDQPLERIRGEQDEALEADADDAQHAEHARGEGLRQVLAEDARPPPTRSTAPAPTAAASPRARPTRPRSGRTSAAPSSSCWRRTAPRSRSCRTPRPGTANDSATNTNCPATAGRAAAIQRRLPKCGPARPKKACATDSSSARISANNPSSTTMRWLLRDGAGRIQ